MRKMMTLLASVTALTLVISGCTSVYTGEEYYGYSPKHKTDNSKEAETLFDDEQTNSDNSGDWQNPLANDNSSVEVRHIYYDYSPMYVPVVVPWWYGYYGWMSYPYPRHWGSNFYIGFGYDPFYDFCWDWYSPWYSYHPYYGYYWPSHNYGWGYYGWFNQPYYAYDPSPAPRRNRDFGPRRRSEFNNNGNEDNQWRVNRRGFSTASNDYSTGIRSINTTSGSSYNRRSAVSTNSGDGYSRGNNSSSGNLYNRRNSRSTNSDVNNRGDVKVYTTPNRTDNSVNRTIETVKGLLNGRNSATDNNSNSGSFNRRTNENTGTSAPTYNRSSEGSTNRSNSSTPSYTAPSRSSSPSYTAPNRSSSPSYSAPSRSSSGSSSGSSRSSGSSSGSGSNSSSGRRGR